MDTIGIGIIGCGMIAPAYFKGIAAYDGFRIVGCADLKPEAATSRAEEFEVQALSVEELLAHPEIQLVINLTIPAVHTAVNTLILEAGKHAYCEKPFALNREDGKRVLEFARSKNLRVGCAPDTFLGSGQQTARRLIDTGTIGKPLSGTAFMPSGGPEGWHLNPGFYFQKGGGPLFDMGPYYLTALVNLLGPAKSITACTSQAYRERDSKHGGRLKVEVPTHYTGILEFHSGALITTIFSFDIFGGTHLPRIELYGETGSLSIPDPNGFDGTVLLRKKPSQHGDRPEWETAESHHPHHGGRGLGPMDLALSAGTNRPGRATGEIAYHVLDMMVAFEDSADRGAKVTLESTCEQPEAVPQNLKPRTWVA